MPLYGRQQAVNQSPEEIKQPEKEPESSEFSENSFDAADLEEWLPVIPNLTDYHHRST